MFGYTAVEFVTLIGGIFGISKIAVWLYDSKVRTEREKELMTLKAKLEMEQKEIEIRFTEQQSKLFKEIALHTQAIESYKQATEQSLNTLAVNVKQLTESVATVSDKVNALTTEHAATKESVKSAHKRISEVQRYE